MSCLQQAVCRQVISLLLILVYLMALLVEGGHVGSKRWLWSLYSQWNCTGMLFLHLISLHAFPQLLFIPLPPQLGALSTGCYIFLWRFTLWALPKPLSSPISTNAVCSCVRPHRDYQLLASPALTLHPTSPPHRKKEKTKKIWLTTPKPYFLSRKLSGITPTLQVRIPFLTHFTGGGLMAAS